MALVARPLAPASARPPTSAGTPLRRCTFRRITAVRGAGRELPTYDVACMFPDRRAPIALGDIERARPICGACTFKGIFRADSD